MRSPRALWVRTAFLTLLGLAMLTPATPATAAGVPNASLSCGTGWVRTTAPYVYAQQDAPGASGIFWAPQLYQHDGRSWHPVATANWFISPVQSSDFNPGSTGGFAGPGWYPYGTINGQLTQTFTWTVPSGYWYAIRNWVYDGSYSNAFAGPIGSQVCRA